MFFRPICEVLLKQEKLTYKSPHIWNGTFKLIRRIVGGVDYKVFNIFYFFFFMQSRLWFSCFIPLNLPCISCMFWKMNMIQSGSQSPSILTYLLKAIWAFVIQLLHFHLLLWNCQAKWNQTLKKASIEGPLQISLILS